jgi:hypothetical protein
VRERRWRVRGGGGAPLSRASVTNRLCRLHAMRARLWASAPSRVGPGAQTWKGCGHNTSLCVSPAGARLQVVAVPFAPRRLAASAAATIPWHHCVTVGRAQVCLSASEMTLAQLEVACVFLKRNFVCTKLLCNMNNLPAEAGFFLAEMLKVGVCFRFRAHCCRAVPPLPRTFEGLGVVISTDWVLAVTVLLRITLWPAARCSDCGPLVPRAARNGALHDAERALRAHATHPAGTSSNLG